MTQHVRRPFTTFLRRGSVVLMAAVLTGLLPAAAGAAPLPASDPEPAVAPLIPAEVAGGQPDPDPFAPAGGLVPSIHYEDAVAHEHDRIAFTAGGRVTVGFTPRATDQWPVAGRAPRALPAGLLSGRDMLPRDTAPTVTRPSAGPQDVPDGSATASAEPAPSAAPSSDASSDPAEAAPGASTDPTANPSADASASLPPVDAPANGPAPVDADRTSLLATADDVAPDPAAKGLFRQVFGFLPYWEVNSSTTTLNYDLLSTIAYFSVGTDTKGNLLKKNSDGTTTTGWGGWTSSKMTSVINAAHQKGTRVVLTITSFAWTTSQADKQKALLGSSTARLNLAKQAAAAVRDRGADGINLDFEPIASGYADEFTALVKTFRSELNRVGSGYQLTFDTTGYIGNYQLEAATGSGAADAIFIMGYDYRTGGSSVAGSIDPIAGSAYDLNDTLLAYTARVPASKLILGVPYYGRAWSTDTDQLHAKNISGTKYGSSSATNYENAVDFLAEYGRRWDSVEQTAWTAYRRENCTKTYGCVTSWRQLYVDDATALKARYDLVNRYGLRGAGIWALGYDGTRPELWQALAAKFQNDTTAPVAGILALAPTQSSESFKVSWTGSDDRGIVSYDVQAAVDGGAWQDWLRGTTATSATYVGSNGHGFAFRVRARDAAGNAGAWGVTQKWDASPTLADGFGRVLVDGLNVRSSAGTEASIVTQVDAGEIVATTSGPVSEDGYQWYKVNLPIDEWAPVGGLRTDVWVAASGSGTTFVSGAAAPNTTRVALGSGFAPAVGARFVALSPARILDTRTGIGLSGAFAASTPRAFQVTGRGGVPSGAVAVTGNLTITGSTAGGYVTLGPSVSANPSTSTLNAPKGDNRAVGVTVKLGDGGTLGAVYKAPSGARTHLIFDVTGYFLAGSGATYVPLTPARLVDSRIALGLKSSLANRTPRTFQVIGRGGVPSGAVAITGNVTVTRSTSRGYVTLGPSVTSRPSTSTLNVPKGDTRANGVTVRLGSGGTLGVVWAGASGSRAHVVFDVTGYFVNSSAGATYYPINSVRLLDTRVPLGIASALVSSQPKGFGVAGRGTIPPGALAVTGTLTMTGQTSGGYFALGSELTATPSTSTLNAPKGDTRANGITVKLRNLDLGLVFKSSSGAKSHAVFDATGYFR